MDGPSTNWELIEVILKDREEKEQYVGSCSLHIVHGAFKLGAEKNGWDIILIFKAAYTILHDTPARMEDFISVTPEERFPLFFCATHWVEDTVVADRLIEVRESITKIVRN